MAQLKQGVRAPKPAGAIAGKVPQVMQMEALECGAACLAMIAAYYGKWLPLERVRTDCGVSRDGSSALNVVKAARLYGFDARGYRFEPSYMRENATFPCIVHWEFNHFIVVRGFKGDKVYVNDPARGEVTMTLEQFDAGFTGVALCMQPTEDFEPGGKPPSVRAFAMERLRGSKAALAFVAITTAITSLLGIVNPALSQVFTDHLLTGEDPGWFGPFIAIMIAMCVIQVLVSGLNALYLLKVQGKMAAVSDAAYCWHVMHLPMTFFSQRSTGDIVSRSAQNASIASQVVSVISPLVVNLAMLVIYLVIMVTYSPLLSMIGIASVAVNIAMARVFSFRRMNLSRVSMRDSANLSSTTTAGLSMIETIKASGAENGFFQRWGGFHANSVAQSCALAVSSTRWGLIPELVTSAANAAVLMSGVYLVLIGEFTIGMVLAFQGYLSQFSAPAQSLISAMESFNDMRTSMERIQDVMSYPRDPLCEGPKLGADDACEKLRGGVELKNVTFGYSPLGTPLIEDFSVTIKPGGSVAFVGTSGCGKSTLSKLITGLYQPWTGEVLFDGVNAADIPHEVRTGSVSVIDQDIVLFNDTVANNIRLWDESIEDYEVVLAARDAGIHDVVMTREGGYEHVLLEGGRDLSGGQRQRLEIARALAQDPTVLIMDEATSALDAQTEQEVMEAIAKRGITRIIIAHRLSAIRDCDEIIVLDAGHVVERGTHEELFAAGGTYANLVSQE